MSVTPEYIVRTCNGCKKKALMRQKEVKKGVPSSLSMIARREARRSSRGNRGKWSQKPQKGYMQGRKHNILLECMRCGAKTNRKNKPRSIKFNITKGANELLLKQFQ